MVAPKARHVNSNGQLYTVGPQGLTLVKSNGSGHHPKPKPKPKRLQDPRPAPLGRKSGLDRLHPDHLADLHKSGLTDDTIAQAGLFSVQPVDIAKITGITAVESLLAFPYDADFTRYKVFPTTLTVQGKKLRYLQPKGSGARLYIPRMLNAGDLKNIQQPLGIVEGEKKALKACQEGLVCVAIGGLWNWLRDGRLLPDLQAIPMQDRDVILYPDSDIWTKPQGNLIQAVYRLVEASQAQGAQVTVCQLPLGPGSTKQGLDDYLRRHTVEDLHTLPHLDLTARQFAAVARQYQAHQPGQAWQLELTKADHHGLRRDTPRNLQLAFAHLEPWASQCWLDVVRNRYMLGDQPLTNELETEARVELERQVGIVCNSQQKVMAALHYQCHQHKRDLLREWLRSLPTWDGQRRLHCWLQAYAHAPDNALSQDVSRLLPASMVARALDPGCQYRYVVILEGPQNSGKSKLVEALASPEWYSEFSQGVEGKEAQMRLKNAWVSEFAELASFSRTEEARLKSFITLKEDAYVPKYLNYEERYKRRTVFVGTHNPTPDNEYFRDQTGNTRYLPIEVKEINVEGFEAIRPQLFAEAMHYYAEHGPQGSGDWWKLSPEGEAIAEQMQEERRQKGVYEEDLRDWLIRTRRTETYWPDIAENFLGLSRKEQVNKSYQMEIAKSLKAIGWEKRTRTSIKGKQVMPWRPGPQWRAAHPARPSRPMRGVHRRRLIEV
jgi:Virulence-associated protein E-like domain/Domain of unknown function (DUF3854)